MPRIPTPRRYLIAYAAVLCAVLIGVLPGCSGTAHDPVRASREALGTVVSVTAYGGTRDPADTREAVDAAFSAMDAVESDLDAHDPASAIYSINSKPDPGAEALPPRAETVLDAICVLEARTWFSPQLLGAAEAWAFEDGGRVPSAGELATALADGRYDFGGAAKGLAIDEAAVALRASAAVDAALITSGSTTLVFGEKPDGEPWKIGVEDPRDPDSVIATIETRGEVTVSTSGDYQRAFDLGGVRYHHILHPGTGRPAAGFRSLTVVGEISGLHSDILSTALFVAGPASAMDYAERHRLGLVLVDAGGRTHIVPGPEDRVWEIALANQ